MDQTSASNKYAELAGNLHPTGDLQPIPVGRLPAQHRPLTATNSVSYYATGAGTRADPYVGWETRVPWTARATFEFTPGGSYFGHTNALSFYETGFSGMTLEGRGSSLYYTGAGTIQTQLDFSANPADALGQSNVNVRDLIVDGGAGGKVVDGVRFYVSHKCEVRNLRVLNGTGQGLRVEGCTLPDVDGYTCSNFYDPEYGDFHANTFAGGIYANYVQSTGNTLSVPIFKNVDVRGCQGTAGIFIDNTFGLKLVASASEANPNGVGLYTGSNAVNVNIDSSDFETNNTATAADLPNGYHSGIVINGRDTLISNCAFIDAGLKIGTTAARTTLVDTALVAVENKGNYATAIGCSQGWQLGLAGNTNNTDVNFVGINCTGDPSGYTSYLPETTVFGRGSNGAVINNSWLGGYTIAPSTASFANQTTKYAVHQHPTTCDTQINGNVVDLMAVGNIVLRLNANGTLCFGTMVSAASVSTVNHAVPVADGAGNIVGYVPIYSTKS